MKTVLIHYLFNIDYLTIACWAGLVVIGVLTVMTLRVLWDIFCS